MNVSNSFHFKFFSSPQTYLAPPVTVKYTHHIKINKAQRQFSSIQSHKLLPKCWQKEKDYVKHPVYNQLIQIIVRLSMTLEIFKCCLPSNSCMSSFSSSTELTPSSSSSSFFPSSLYKIWQLQKNVRIFINIYCSCSAVMGDAVQLRLPPSISSGFTGTPALLFYTPGSRGTWELSVLPKNTKQWLRPVF